MIGIVSWAAARARMMVALAVLALLPVALGHRMATPPRPARDR